MSKSYSYAIIASKSNLYACNLRRKKKKNFPTLETQIDC